MFRPCIDLHEGKVKQIVGGTLESKVQSPKSKARGPFSAINAADDKRSADQRTEEGVQGSGFRVQGSDVSGQWSVVSGLGEGGLRTNFVSDKPATWYAALYKKDALKGGHVIMLGPGNEVEARSALAAYPGGLQIGGGINQENASVWLDAGASHVIVTSWVFREGTLDWQRLGRLLKAVGKERLVLDLSCRKKVSSVRYQVSGSENWRSGVAEEDYFVVTDRWQKFTELAITKATLQKLACYCAEFLIHAVDVEGLCSGIDRELVSRLGRWTPIPTTYAGGANSLEDLEEVTRLGKGKLDLTIGSALDIFGGTGVRYADVVEWNRRHESG
ncbi:MAG: phosphoribosylformimino-5-aminoimidazole carboxamide ribotide isomerase [Verrucomicrobia bacterium]|nr:MAG: phosphoribosylformimino-5-aminoimidazole carboxamide ribotide isomerase [Verrucomicrobiota bacterium]